MNKINKTKSWFFEKITNKTGKTLMRKKKKMQTNIKIKMGTLLLLSDKLKGQKRGVTKNLRPNNFDNLDEMDKCLEIPN